MNTRHRVSYVFLKAPDPGLIARLKTIIICLTGNPAFATLTALLADLTAALTAFETAVSARAQNNSALLTARRDETRETLLDVTRQTGAAVQSIALNNLALLLSSGFTARSKSTAQTPLATPAINNAVNLGSKQVLLRLSPVINAKSYETRLSTDNGRTWTSGGISPQARRIILSNLVPATTYTIQSRAIGGSTGQSDWSTPVTIMAM